jgi:hypothetical protein
MKTVNLSQLSDPDVLREYSPRMLVALMDDHRAYLATKGIELPPVGQEDELDIEALSSVFTSTGDFPKELLDRFHMVRQMSGPRQMDRILATVQERQVQFPLPLADCSPEDIAAHLLLTNPLLFQELHAELAVTRYRAFAYFVPHRKKPNFKPPTSMAALEKALNGWYETHQRGRDCQGVLAAAWGGILVSCAPRRTVEARGTGEVARWCLGQRDLSPGTAWAGDLQRTSGRSPDARGFGT